MVFCDRGRPDSLTYAELASLVLEEDLHSLLDAQGYGQIFILTAISRFKIRDFSGRISNRQCSLCIRELLERACRERGYPPVGVPELSIEDRACLVLRELGLKLRGTKATLWI